MVRSEVDFERPDADLDHHKGRSKDKDRSKDRDRDADHDDDRFRDRDRDRIKEREKVRDREKERDRDREKVKDRDKEKEKERTRDRDRERGDKEKPKDRDRDKEKDRDREKERDVAFDREKERDRDKERERDKDEKKKERAKDAGRDRDADFGKERRKEKDKRDRDGENREREKDKDRDREREKDRARDRDSFNRPRDRDYEKEREHDREREHDNDREMQKNHSKAKQREERGVEKSEEEAQQEKARDKFPQDGNSGRRSEMQGKGKSDTGNEIAAWVNKSRNLEDQKKIEERIKAARTARLLAEQEEEDSDREEEDRNVHTGKDLAGLKVLHGLDKVMEGGAVVLTLKDREVLAGDDVNDELDELENFEIAQQKARDGAYKAAKKKAGIYEDKFQNDIDAVRTMLPQYDEEMKDEGVALDETGSFNAESRKKLEELRKKLEGGGLKAHDSLSGAANIASDFYTQEEMSVFNKPKKKKKLRKKDVFDIDALEAEAKAEGLGADDLGNRASGTKKARQQIEEKAAEESRRSAYLSAYSKAINASKKLRGVDAIEAMETENDNSVVFGGDEDDELYRSLHRARQAALKKQTQNTGFSAGPQAVVAALRQANEINSEAGAADDASDKDKTAVILTETEEFCRSLQLDAVLLRRPAPKEAFPEEDDEDTAMLPVEEPSLGSDGGWREVKETDNLEMPKENEEEDVNVEETIKEVSVGKGLAGALSLLKERGVLKETVDWGGRNMDKKKSKLVGIVNQQEKFRDREIILDRLDEFGRTMTPKEAFRKLSHKFHGKGPGKMKQEKKMKQYEEEMKLKQMSSGDTPLLSMEKMREAQAKMHTPYIVISGHIKPGQTSDPKSGFGTVEKEPIGSLTPMLGDKKVEHFLGIKRKPESGTMGPPPPKKPKSGT